jgi:hypothetical protein
MGALSVSFSAHVDWFGVISLLMYEDPSTLVSRRCKFHTFVRVIEQIKNELVVSDGQATQQDSNPQFSISPARSVIVSLMESPDSIVRRPLLRNGLFEQWLIVSTDTLQR